MKIFQMEETGNKIEASKSFLENRPITVGIDSGGKFLVSFDKKDFRSISAENIVYMFRLFEIDYSVLRKDIDTLIKETNQKAGIKKTAHFDFPFKEMIIQALQSNRDHWVQAAIPWMKEIGTGLFRDYIVEASKDRSLSQKLRHELLKLKK